ncbi:galactose mutarotase [Pasteurellaceae bacterium Macca]|nr:galactose mutarotase [Pasteurellaceae bacterium Macca]
MQCFELHNDFLHIVVSDFGASWLSCQVKHQNQWQEVLVTTTPERWQENSAYFGATIGRYANRIAHGRYTLNGQHYQLHQNNGEHHLHGGLVGGDKKRWEVVFATPQGMRFRNYFADGEEGFGGNVWAEVEYRLHNNELTILFDAESDLATPLCLTNHAYFNLSGEATIHHHHLQINGDHYLPVDETGIPNAPLRSVVGTSFDFRQGKTLGQDLLKDADQQKVKGYDHAFRLTKNDLNSTACLLSAKGLNLEISTTLPALQLYTGNWLAGQPNMTGGEYGDYAGVALEPEFFPDTPNHPEWQHLGGISQAGERYQHAIRYRFSAP